MPVLTLPLALIALSSVPALLAIYWLRNRYRRQVVSSLHLWLDHSAAREGGTRVKRIQIPLLLLLEILALILLVLAATDPRVQMSRAERPLVAVLDDSYSMQAGARDRAADALRKLLESEGRFSVRVLLAQQEPRALTEPLGVLSEVDAALAGWRCESPTADLDRAVALAYELGGPQARVLVLTDHEPAEDPGEGRLRWWAFGEARPNVAIINAVRTTGDDQRQRVLLEIANYASARVRSELRLNDMPREIELSPGETRRMWVDVIDATTPFRAQLADDPLPFDNAAVLLPDTARPVRVRVNVAHERLAALINKALAASGRAEVSRYGPDLVITDRAETLAAGAESWLVRFVVEDEPAAFVGPFLVDEHHALTDGLELPGVVWAAASDQPMPGRPLIAAGNTPLVSVVERAGAVEGVVSLRYDVHVRLNPDRSTIQSTANFPILLWNLLAWRQSALPGLSQVNARLGSRVTLITEPGVETMRLTDPHAQATDLPVHDRALTVTADIPGVYTLTTEADEYRFAVNAMSGDESDLRGAATDRVGTWLTQETLRRQYTSIAWIGLLAVLGLLTLHAALVSRAGGGRA